MFGLAPVVLFLATSMDGFGPLGRASRGYATPVLAAEIGIVLIALVERMRFSLRPPWPWLCLALLLALAFYSATTAPSPILAYRQTGFWLIHLAFGFSIAHLSARDIIRPDQLVRSIIVGFLAFFSIFLVFAATRPSGFNWVSDLPGFANIRWLGYYAAAIVALSVPALMRGAKLETVAAAAALLLVLWTGSRGGIFAVVTGLAAAATIVPVLRNRGLAIRLAATFAVALALSLAFDHLIPIQGADRIVTDFQGEAGGSGRVELWRGTIGYILQRPWLGWGDGQTYLLAGGPINVAQPHNIVLQIMQAWGLAGMALVAALIAWLAPRMTAASAEYPAAVLCVIVLTAFSMIDGTLHHVLPVAIVAACLGIAMSPSARTSRI